MLGERGGVDGVVEVDGDRGWPEHPVAGAVMLEGADQADGHDGDTELLREAKAAVLKFVDVTGASALGFRKNDEAGAAVDGVLGEAPHALDVGRAAHVGNGNIAETLHVPTVGGDFEVGFQFPTAHELRDSAVKHERVEDVYVIGHEEGRAVGIETRRANDLHACAGKEGDATAEGALQPVVLAHIEEDVEEHKKRRGDEEMHQAEGPENDAAQREVDAPHM